MAAIFTSVPTTQAPGRIKREQFVNFKALMENKDLVQTNMLFSLKAGFCFCSVIYIFYFATDIYVPPETFFTLLVKHVALAISELVFHGRNEETFSF